VLRAMIWIILPVAVIGYFTRAYLARLIFKNIAPEIALIFGFLVGAIIFRTLYAIISRYFYSQKDTRTPLFVSIFAIGLNIFLAFTLAKPSSYGVAGLAIAQSVVAAVEVFILLMIMLWRDHRLFSAEFWSGLVRILSVTGFTILTTYTMVTIIPLATTDRGFTTLGAKLLSIIIPSLAVHIGVSSIFTEDFQTIKQMEGLSGFTNSTYLIANNNGRELSVRVAHAGDQVALYCSQGTYGRVEVADSNRDIVEFRILSPDTRK
jgi:peptidoglycan biosynthesis protein MviN/MurJ (putative lipid II flippase)